eukprot:TRINITY_DN6524_c0_g3_i2.p1 TRINITY_DN6524_c0_g3~~TRINITY_DN6524_c0_g3_i2.p1  ORF type:complete len:647 (+),score=78.91 TRINITY_DN6524_c0_g3_i2:86-2026(+)
MKDDAQSSDSQSANILLYCMVGIYFVGLVGIAKAAHRFKLDAASSLGPVQAHFGGSFKAPLLILTTFSTVYSGFTVTGIPEEAYKKGFVSLRWIGATLVIVAGMLLFYPRLRRLCVERGYMSPNDFITDRYRSSRLSFLCAFCGVVPMLIYITAQMLAFAAMFEGMTLGAVPKSVSMLIFCIAILSMEAIGGMNSVVLTDSLQAVLMIASFLAVPFVLGSTFGFLPSMAAPDCPELFWVSTNATTSSYASPQECETPNSGSCIAAGCIAAVKPSFYEFPETSTMCSILFFLFNMIAAPLTPHMIQRAHIASDDHDLRLMMGAMLVAPFIAQTPGILIGLTKAAYVSSWPAVAQEATAFSSVAAQLLSVGWIEYALVTVMTCSTMAAVMSTADSALMGASNVVSVDIFKGIFCPNASPQSVIRVGEVHSVLLCSIAFGLGMTLSVDQFGSIIVFQNGILLQLLPAFGLGLYFEIAERPVTFGLVTGILSLLLLAFLGNPLDPYVPVINVSVFFNFAAVAIFQLLAPASQPSNTHTEEPEPSTSSAEPKLINSVTAADIQNLMASSKEPPAMLILLMLLLAFLSVPWYGTPGRAEPIWAGLPRWGFIQISVFVVVFAIGVCAAYAWKPPKSETKPEAVPEEFVDVTVT